MSYVFDKVSVPADRARINVADPVEVRWWSKSLVAAKDSCSKRYRAPEIQRQRSNSCLTFGRDLASVRGEH